MKTEPRIPKKIDILGERFKVRIENNLIDGDTRVAGLCDFHTKTIHVDSDASEEQMFITLIHECNHAFLEITGLNQNMTPNEIESFCQLNGYFIKQFIKAFN